MDVDRLFREARNWEKVRPAFLICGLCLATLIVQAADQPASVRLRQFDALEIENLDYIAAATAKQAANVAEMIPEELLQGFRDDVSQKVIALHRFHRVMEYRDPKVKQPETEHPLVLGCKILRLSPGSRTKTIVLGRGWGSGVIEMDCSLSARATGRVIWSQRITGRAPRAGYSSRVHMLKALQTIYQKLAKAIDGAW